MRDTLKGPDTEPRPARALVTLTSQPPAAAVESEPARGRPDLSTLADVGQADFPEAQVRQIANALAAHSMDFNTEHLRCGKGSPEAARSVATHTAEASPAITEAMLTGTDQQAGKDRRQ